MKQLALSIGTTPIQLPNQVQHINDAAGTFGVNLINNAITLILSVSILLAFIFFLIGGFKWMMSQGDKKQVEEAQKTITYSVIGLLVIFLSFFIINLIGYAFGTGSLINVFIPSH